MISSAETTVFYLFDVAEAIDLGVVSRLAGHTATQSKIAQRPSTPSYTSSTRSRPFRSTASARACRRSTACACG